MVWFFRASAGYLHWTWNMDLRLAALVPGDVDKKNKKATNLFLRFDPASWRS
jgi:hypothetical protein